MKMKEIEVRVGCGSLAPLLDPPLQKRFFYFIVVYYFEELLLLLLVVVSLMFSGLLSTMLHWVFYQTPGIQVVMYCFTLTL